MFKPGLRQVIVGESIARRYPDAQIGKQVRFRPGMWEVVGVFRVGDSAANSEIWADLNQLRGGFRTTGRKQLAAGASDIRIDVACPAGRRDRSSCERRNKTRAKKKLRFPCPKTHCPRRWRRYGR